MPHFGLMNEEALGPVEGPLMRAKLHIRCGRRRLREGKISAGIVTFYDALVSAMKWYIAQDDRKKLLRITEKDDMTDDRTMFEVLKRSRVIGGAQDFEAIDRVVEKALAGEMPGYDYSKFLTDMESILTGLGVLPFDESDLPPEDPSTF
ncbi:MAG: hypothetical protein P8013_14855 [Candidatus Sulfobium sp.]|jgi:hypothetical protein